jgi:hypothetical protein
LAARSDGEANDSVVSNSVKPLSLWSIGPECEKVLQSMPLFLSLEGDQLG